MCKYRNRNKFLEEIGIRLYEERCSRGYSLERVVSELKNIEFSAELCEIEKGVQGSGVEDLVLLDALARYYNVSLEYLVFGSNKNAENAGEITGADDFSFRHKRLFKEIVVESEEQENKLLNVTDIIDKEDPIKFRRAGTDEINKYKGIVVPRRREITELMRRTLLMLGYDSHWIRRVHGCHPYEYMEGDIFQGLEISQEKTGFGNIVICRRPVLLRNRGEVEIPVNVSEDGVILEKMDLYAFDEKDTVVGHIRGYIFKLESVCGPDVSKIERYCNENEFFRLKEGFQVAVKNNLLEYILLWEIKRKKRSSEELDIRISPEIVYTVENACLFVATDVYVKSNNRGKGVFVGMKDHIKKVIPLCFEYYGIEELIEATDVYRAKLIVHSLGLEDVINPSPYEGKKSYAFRKYPIDEVVVPE